MGCDCGRWVAAAQDRVPSHDFVLAAMNLRVTLANNSQLIN